MAAKRRQRGAGTITQTSSRRWRLRVPVDGRQVTYGTYETEGDAADAQAQWRLTHRLPAYQVQPVADDLTRAAIGEMRCDEWFGRWQEAKKARRSRGASQQQTWRRGVDSSA
jgi:hypothetical protein